MSLMTPEQASSTLKELVRYVWPNNADEWAHIYEAILVLTSELAAKDGKIERLKGLVRLGEQHGNALQQAWDELLPARASLVAADALAGQGLREYGGQGWVCVVCGAYTNDHHTESIQHRDDCELAAYTATRMPDVAEAFKKLREAHVDAGSPLDGVDPTTTYPPQPHEDRPGSTP